MQDNERDTLRVGLIQLRCSPDAEANLAAAIAACEHAAEQGAKLVCLPELFLSPYFCQSEDAAHFDLAEPVPGPTTEALCKLAAERDLVVVGSLFERRTEGLYHNTAVVIDSDGKLVGRYRKMHIPDDPLYYEKFYFTPGDLGFAAHATRVGRVGTLVCWDQWFPEAARLTALSGAQILTYPTAIGWQFDEGDDVDASQHDAWETIQRSHAIANGTFVIAVNRVGFEATSPASSMQGIRFWGQSFVADPFGRVLARASDSEPETLVVDLDLKQIEATRRNWPFLRDRRIDAYADLGRRFRD